MALCPYIKTARIQLRAAQFLPESLVPSSRAILPVRYCVSLKAVGPPFPVLFSLLNLSGSADVSYAIEVSINCDSTGCQPNLCTIVTNRVSARSGAGSIGSFTTSVVDEQPCLKVEATCKTSGVVDPDLAHTARCCQHTNFFSHNLPM